MHQVERELVFGKYMVSLGLRKSLDLEDDGGESEWEVYSHLVSGSDVVLHSGCTRDEAETIMTYRLATSSITQLSTYIVTKDDAAVDSRYVVRVFVDRHQDKHACLIEEVTGRVYLVQTGTESECNVMSDKLVRDIVRYGIMFRGGNGDNEREAQVGDIT